MRRYLFSPAQTSIRINYGDKKRNLVFQSRLEWIDMEAFYTRLRHNFFASGSQSIQRLRFLCGAKNRLSFFLFLLHRNGISAPPAARRRRRRRRRRHRRRRRRHRRSLAI